MPTDCTNLSCTRPYEIRPMNPLQFSEHFCNRCVLPKLLDFAEMLEISTLVDFPRNYFGAEVYPTISENKPIYFLPGAKIIKKR